MSFADATKVTREKPGLYSGRIHEGWDILGVANGGYLMSIATRAMSGEAPGRRLVSVTGHFLNPGHAGAVEVEVEPLKTGREFTTVRSMMRAGTKPLVSLTGSLAEGNRTDPHFEMLRGSPPDLPDPDECVRGAASDDAPFPPPVVDRYDLRVHPEDVGGALGQPSGSSQFRGWFRLLDDEPMDEPAIVLATDAFLPAVFNAGQPTAWTPTLDMTVHIRKPGPHEWLRCSFQTRFVTGGLLEEDGEIWDAAGNLVALSRQLALVAREE